MSNIELIKKLTYNLSDFYFLDDYIIFFSENYIFKIYNKILYKIPFIKDNNIILFVKIHNNYIHILAKCNKFVNSRNYILYRISLDNITQKIFENKLNFKQALIILDFTINNDNILSIITNNNDIIVYQLEYNSFKIIELICEYVGKSYIPNIKEHLEYSFIIQPVYVGYDIYHQYFESKPNYFTEHFHTILPIIDKDQSSTIIGLHKSRNYYILNIVSKYNPLIKIATIRIYNNNTFAIIDDHIIIYNTSQYVKPHIIQPIINLYNFEIKLEYKQIIEFCKENKICTDFVIINDNKKGQLICKKKNNLFYTLCFKKDIEHENSIIDYKMFKEMYKYEYDIYYNNINLTISKPYNNLYNLLKDFEKIE